MFTRSLVVSITPKGKTVNTIYILDPENNARPVSWQEYDAWEAEIPKENRTALGKRLAVDHFGSVVVVTTFMATPIGYFGRKPQLWITLTIGPGIWEESRYSSHRAALSGHASACKVAGGFSSPQKNPSGSLAHAS